MHPACRRLPRTALPAVIALALTGLAPAAHAQAAPGTRPAAAAREAAVILDPFEVSAGSTSGYLAAEATTGTRYAAPIKEIPFPVNVITGEFLENILAWDFSDAAAYTSGFAPTEGTGEFNMRGIRNGSHYKNGVREGGVFSPIAIERIELIKGPNAASYGATEPTGLRNVVTKAGGPRPAQSLRLTYGTDDFSRVAVDIDQPLIADKLYSRWSASYEHSEQFAYDFARFRRAVAYNSLTWKIGPQTVLTTRTEYFKARQHNLSFVSLPFVLSPFTNNGQTVQQASGMFGLREWERYRSVNLAGPQPYNEVEYWQATSTLSHRFADWLSARFLGNHWERYQNRYSNDLAGTNAGAYTVANGVLNGTRSQTLNRGREFQDNAQLDLLASFNTGAVSHRVLLTADYYTTDTASVSRRTSRPDVITNLDAAFKGTAPWSNASFPYYFELYNYAVWDLLNGNTKGGRDTKGVMFSERAGLWENKLVLTFGGRHDETQARSIDFRAARTVRGQNIPVGQLFKDTVIKADTFNAGATYRITRELSAYAGYSESFNASSTTAVDINNNIVPNIEGDGLEFGLKAGFMQDRLTFTLGRFVNNKSNVTRAALDALGNPLSIPGTTIRYNVLNDIRSQGYEFDGNWRATDSLAFNLGVGYTDIRYTKVPNVTESYLLGVRPEGTPEWTGGLNTEYSFRSGPLKGVGLRVGVRYVGTSILISGQSVFGDSGVKGPPVTVGGRAFDTYYFAMPDYFLVEGGLSYGWRSGNRRYGHRVSLDLKNALDEKYLRNRRPGDPFAAFFSYEIKR